MQDSLPAAGPALPGGIGYPQGSCERFHGCDDSPFPSFLARCQFVFSRGEIRYQFVFSGKNDELTPDFSELTPDFPNCRVGKGARRARSSFGFPLPPLKFRTVGFPQYGFKWTVSGDLRRHPGA